MRERDIRGTWAKHQAIARRAGWYWGLLVGVPFGLAVGVLLAYLVLR